MDYRIAIPTLGRHSLINAQTLKMIKTNNIHPSKVILFVVEEEYKQYRSVVPQEYDIIIGVRGVVEQREFIETFFPQDQNILFLDDDVNEVDLSLTNYLSLDDFIIDAFKQTRERGAYIFSVYPVYNPFFRKDREPVTEYLSYMVGGFQGIINRNGSIDKPYDQELRITYTREGNKEDVEKSILYFKKDGKTVRFNRIGYKTKYYGSLGGLGTLKERLPKMMIGSNILQQNFPEYGKIKIRKNGLYEFVLNRLHKPNEEDKRIDVFPSINPEELVDLYNMLEEITIPHATYRRGFPKHRAVCFGITKKRYTQIVELSSSSLKYPEIYQEILRIGKMICPFEFTSIHVNNNVTSPPHKDENNTSKSVLLSFGDYTGGNIMIEGKVYDANCTPIMFNGGILEHCNTPDLEGTKYSLVFYCIKK